MKHSLLSIAVINLLFLSAGTLKAEPAQRWYIDRVKDGVYCEPPNFIKGAGVWLMPSKDKSDNKLYLKSIKTSVLPGKGSHDLNIPCNPIQETKDFVELQCKGKDKSADVDVRYLAMKDQNVGPMKVTYGQEIVQQDHTDCIPAGTQLQDWHFFRDGYGKTLEKLLGKQQKAELIESAPMEQGISAS